ncbi:MAG: TraR/DksA C4-type zinc finger protein [bacterium]|nr:TraR/DksA C4-type zinc finger protein [bacterium]
MDAAIARQLLAMERRRVERVLGYVDTETRAASPDLVEAVAGASDREPADAATDLTTSMLALTHHRRLRLRLEALREAEERLALGLFDRCKLCQTTIANARLEKVPWAMTCRTCAQEDEVHD